MYEYTEWSHIYIFILYSVPSIYDSHTSLYIPCHLLIIHIPHLALSISLDTSYGSYDSELQSESPCGGGCVLLMR
jgi:hypothetical protein